MSKRNVGGIDRVARFVVGFGLLGVVLFAPIGIVWKAVAGLISVVALATAATHYCPLNAALGVNTFKRDEAAKK